MSIPDTRGLPITVFDIDAHPEVRALIQRLVSSQLNARDEDKLFEMMLKNSSFHWWFETEKDRMGTRGDKLVREKFWNFSHKAMGRLACRIIEGRSQSCPTSDNKSSMIFSISLRADLIKFADGSAPQSLDMDTLVKGFLDEGAEVDGFLMELFEIRSSLSAEQRNCWRDWKAACERWQRDNPSSGGAGCPSSPQSTARSRLQARYIERAMGGASASGGFSGRSNSPQSRGPSRTASSHAGQAAGPSAASHRANAASREQALIDLLSEMSTEDSAPRKRSKRAERKARKSQPASSVPKARAESPPAAAAAAISPQSSPRTARWETEFTSVCREATEKADSKRNVIEKSGYWIALDRASSDTQQGINRMRLTADKANKMVLRAHFPPSNFTSAVPRTTSAAIKALRSLQEAVLRLTEAEMLKIPTGRAPSESREETEVILDRERADITVLPERPGGRRRQR